MASVNTRPDSSIFTAADELETNFSGGKLTLTAGPE